jgi:hypothetical protein
MAAVTATRTQAKRAITVRALAFVEADLADPKDKRRDITAD